MWGWSKRFKLLRTSTVRYTQLSSTFLTSPAHNPPLELHTDTTGEHICQVSETKPGGACRVKSALTTVWERACS